MAADGVCWATTKFALFDLHIPDRMMEEALSKADAVAAASQLGRLDLASALLAIAAILISLAAVVAFIEVRAKASRSAREAALSEVKSISPDVIRNYLSENPALWLTVLRENSWIVEAAIRNVLAERDVPAEEANEIAEAMSKEEGGNGETS